MWVRMFTFLSICSMETHFQSLWGWGGRSSHRYRQIIPAQPLLAFKDVQPWDWHLGQEDLCTELSVTRSIKATCTPGTLHSFHCLHLQAWKTVFSKCPCVPGHHQCSQPSSPAGLQGSNEKLVPKDQGLSQPRKSQNLNFNIMFKAYKIIRKPFVFLFLTTWNCSSK